MNEKNQIRIFRDPLDPRELSFGFSQPHTGNYLDYETGAPRTPVKCNLCGKSIELETIEQISRWIVNHDCNYGK